jgi:hypothetical protein
MCIRATLALLLPVLWWASPAELAAAQVAPENVCTTQMIGAATINIPSVTLQPRFRLNGRPFPGATAGAAVITLWASAPSELFGGPQLVLGETQLPRTAVRVVPGTYDVYYSWISGSGVPRNQLTRVMHDVRIDADGEFIVDIPMIRVTGVKQHNAAAFSYEGAAALSLRGSDWPGTVPLGAAQPANFNVAIIPGRYAFEYDWLQGANFPHNRHAVVRELELTASVKGLALNVPSVIQSFEFRHNGSPFPATLYERGDIVLRRGVREELLLGSSHEGSAAVVRVIPATYNAHWRHRAGANVPRNADAKFKQGLIVTGAPRVLNVPSVEIAGDLRVNGEAPPQSAYENARIHLVGRTPGDSVSLGETRYGAYERLVIPGLYNIVYEHVAGAAVLPSNPRATLAKDWRVEDNPSRTIDIPVGIYKGDFLLNGSNPPASQYEHGAISVVSASPDEDPVPLGDTRYGGFERRLLPRWYQAAYAHLAGANVPRNAFTTFGPKRLVTNDAELIGDLNVTSGPLTVSYQHNGVALPSGGPQNARVHLVRGRNYLQLYESIVPVHEMEVMPGTFDLYYQYRGGGGLPHNAFMRIGCWKLTR